MNGPTAHARTARAAYVLVIGRGLGAYGATLTTFALDVWVYMQTGSYSLFASLALMAMLPPLVVGPIAGVILDRSSKKVALILCDCVSLFAVALALTADLAAELSLWLVAVVMVVLSTAEAIRWPATSAAICLLTEVQHRAKVNGIAEACRSLAVMAGPVSGAAVLQWFGISGILLCTCSVYLLVLSCLAVINFIELTPATKASLRMLKGELLGGWQWLSGRRDLLSLLVFFAAANFAFSVYVVSQAPYVLSFSDTHVLGICFALDGVGVLVGGLGFAWWFKHADRLRLIIFGILIESLTMIFWGIVRTPVYLYVCAFAVGMLAAVVNAASQTLWQAAVPLPLQGRIFTLRSTIVSSLTPIAVLVSIPAAKYVFSPLFQLDPTSHYISRLISIWGTGTAGTLGLLVSSFAVGVAALALRIHGADDRRFAGLARAEIGR